MLTRTNDAVLIPSQNWFQNRRAKAKQQKKQDDYEKTKKESGEPGEETKEEVKEEEDSDEDDKPDSTSQETSNTGASSDTTPSKPSGTTRSPQRNHPCPERRAAAQASFARALASAERARLMRNQQVYMPSTAQTIPMHISQPMTLGTQIPSTLISQPQAMSVPIVAPQPRQSIPMPMLTELPTAVPSQTTDSFWNPDATDSWVTQQSAHGNMGFDFGFDVPEPTALPGQESVVTPGESASQNYENPEVWTHPMTTPTLTNSTQYGMPDTSEPVSSNQFPTIMSNHVGRRGPSADHVSHNLESMGIAQPPQIPTVTSSGSVSSATSDGADLASRRNRPRPANLTLGHGTMRSRSYGQLSIASPTYRTGMTPPTNQSLRHTKSTGHALNSHYAGIRKSSLPHKSPLQNSFREAEYKRLIEARVAQAQLSTNTMTQPQHPMPGPNQDINIPYRIMNHSTSAFNSPPTTPYNQNFFAQPQAQQPTAIQQQYASVSETPPYSAGPMTSTSWDWSVTSPELAQFPQATLMPSLPFSSCADDPSMTSWGTEFEQQQMYGLTTPTGLTGSDFQFHDLQNQKPEEAKTPASRNFAFENRGQRDFAY